MDPLDELAKVGREHIRLQKRLDASRDRLYRLIIENANSGVGTSEMARLSGYCKDSVRIILRQAGVAPHSIGRPRKFKG